MKRVTRNDVAKRAGVSPAVVSYVMNNSNYVSEQKRQAVLKAVEELQYSPNIFAQGLRTNRSYQIALVGDTLQEELYGELSARLAERGYYTGLFFSKDDEIFLSKLIDGRFDAVFMASNRFSNQQLNRIVDSGIPLILYQSREYEGLDPRIVIRAPAIYDGVSQVIQYLIDKGHRRIAYVPPLKYSTSGVGGNDYRARAYSDTLHRNRIPVDPSLYCDHSESVESILGDVERMLTAYGAEKRPTAFFASDDHMAAQVMLCIRRCGFQVPEDVAVTGWGNIASSCITTPQLTTFDIQIPLFAREVADALMELVAGEKPEDRLYPGHLIVREST